jgi:hypothetical protein
MSIYAFPAVATTDEGALGTVIDVYGVAVAPEDAEPVPAALIAFT